MKLSLAISPCPNDTFMFDAMLNGRIDTEGLEFEVVGVQEASYRSPDGTTGTRMVVQLRDVTPEP